MFDTIITFSSTGDPFTVGDLFMFFIIFSPIILGCIWLFLSGIYDVKYTSICSYNRFKKRLRALGVRSKIPYSLYRDFYYKFIDSSQKDVFDNAFEYWLSGPDGQNLLRGGTDE